MEQAQEQLVDTEEKFDSVSMEFRQIIKDHLRLIKNMEQDDLGNLDLYDQTEEVNRQNLNVIAYCMTFLLYSFSDVDAFTHKSNIDWIAKQIISALKASAKNHQLDKPMYYFLKDKIRDYLKSINKELTRIDDQPIDVWQHSYETFDRKLKKLGLPADFVSH